MPAGYKKAKAHYYRLVVILDDRTSDICRALSAQNKVYPLNTALEVMDNLQSLNTRSSSLDNARDYIKALAPWVKDDQVVCLVFVVSIVVSPVFLSTFLR